MRKLIAASAMVIMAAGSGMAATWPAQAHAAHAHRPPSRCRYYPQIHTEVCGFTLVRHPLPYNPGGPVRLAP